MKTFILILSISTLFALGCEKSDDIFIDEPTSAIEKTPLAVVQPGDIEPIPDDEPEICPRHGKRKGKGHSKGKGKGHWKTKTWNK